MNTCMGTINGTSVDRLIVAMQIYWYLHALKPGVNNEQACTTTWSEYMNMHLVNTCKQWRKYRLSYVLQVCHKRNTLECTMVCAHDEEYAHEYLHGNN